MAILPSRESAWTVPETWIRPAKDDHDEECDEPISVDEVKFEQPQFLQFTAVW